jgi:hypothetical protein
LMASSKLTSDVALISLTRATEPMTNLLGSGFDDRVAVSLARGGLPRVLVMNDTFGGPTRSQPLS